MSCAHLSATLCRRSDLKSTYHQIPMAPENKKYTAFEAESVVFQFRRFSLGVSNGVVVFQ